MDVASNNLLDEALPMLNELYAAAVADAQGRRLVFAGDSAGGGLSVVQAIRGRDNGWRAADHLVLFAPWLDVTLSDPEAERLEAKDPILRCVGARDDGRAWAGARPTTDPLVSPINDDLSDLPPMTIIQGGCDIFLPDAVAFTNKARAAGTPIELVVEPGGFHVYPAAFWTPEARRAYAVTAKAILG